jgi:hypothetical protein
VKIVAITILVVLAPLWIPILAVRVSISIADALSDLIAEALP